MLVHDDTTSLMIDGFVSRPPLRRVLLGRVSPDRGKVTEALQRLGVERLDAVLCAHSHMDHALDAPLVAELTGAQLIGSASTANVGRGWGLPEERLDVVGDGDVRRFGDVGCTFVRVPHTPADPVPGTIDAPLVPPAKFTAWRMGGDHAFLITRGPRSILVNASTNFVPGKLDDRRADVVYLGIATPGRQPERFRQDYWDHVVLATGARRVIPVHWDDMRTSLDKPLKPLPGAADDLDTSLRFLTERGRADGVEVLLPHTWAVTDPFAGL
jgi:L-ascorbate metabolism protein UlaG (beta-lactamase superfamily)